MSLSLKGLGTIGVNVLEGEGVFVRSATWFWRGRLWRLEIGFRAKAVLLS